MTTQNTRTAPHTAIVREIPIASLRESPFNPRKTFDQAALAELSISIAGQGILQPLVVRPVVDQDIRHTHELVFGHRRLRAAELAGLTHVPCLVTAMSNAEAALAQVHENGQRQDVSALEEADAYAQLRDVHGLDVAAITASIGKSQSHVYGRLKLATLAPVVREAMTKEAFPAEAAIELARVKSHAEQAVMLRRLRDSNGGWLSTRAAKDLIRWRWKDDTGLVAWDPTDAGLVAAAGACTNCPHRAGNDPELADIMAPGVCTNSPCFAAKTDAWLTLEAARLSAAGHVVLLGHAAAEVLKGTHADYPDGALRQAVYLMPAAPGDDTRTDAVEAIEMLGINLGTDLVMAQRGGALTHYLTAAGRDRLVSAWRAKFGIVEPISPPRDEPATQDTRTRAQSGWSVAERIVTNTSAWKRVRRAVALQILRTPRTIDDLRLIAEMMFFIGDCISMNANSLVFELLGFAFARKQALAKDGPTFDEDEWLKSAVRALSADDLAGLMVASAVDAQLDYGDMWVEKVSQEQASRLAATVASNGIDIVAAAAGADTPRPAAPDRDPNTAEMFESATA